MTLAITPQQNELELNQVFSLAQNDPLPEEIDEDTSYVILRASHHWRSDIPVWWGDRQDCYPRFCYPDNGPFIRANDWSEIQPIERAEDLLYSLNETTETGIIFEDGSYIGLDDTWNRQAGYPDYKGIQELFDLTRDEFKDKNWIIVTPFGWYPIQDHDDVTEIQKTTLTSLGQDPEWIYYYTDEEVNALAKKYRTKPKNVGLFVELRMIPEKPYSCEKIPYEQAFPNGNHAMDKLRTDKQAFINDFIAKRKIPRAQVMALVAK